MMGLRRGNNVEQKEECQKPGGATREGWGEPQREQTTEIEGENENSNDVEVLR